MILQSIALDLKRIALAYHSGSIRMGDIFFREVIKRKKNLDMALLSETLKKLVTKLDSLQTEENYQKRAEDALLYSTLFLSFAK